MVNLTKDRVRILAALCALLVLAAVLVRQFAPRAVPSTGAFYRDRGKVAGPLPRIDLARLERRAKPSAAGETDVFDFATPPPSRVAAAPPPPLPTQVAAATASETPSPPATVPAMNVKYIGAVADKRGLKVAVLMTDHKEVLTGRPGDVVANRLKIVSIGLESVDVQDVGSERVRRIPLRAN